MTDGVLSLIAAYTATIAAHPPLAGRLNPLLGDHRAHLDALRAARDPAPTPSGAAGASAAPSGAAGAAATETSPDASGSPAPDAATASPAPVPADQNAAVSALKGAEKAARDATTSACLSAPARYASLLGSITACRSCHLEVL